MPNWLHRSRQKRLEAEGLAKIQDVCNRVLREGRGKSFEEVKVLLADEWRRAEHSELVEPQLSKFAAMLTLAIAEGRPIEVTPGWT